MKTEGKRVCVKRGEGKHEMGGNARRGGAPDDGGREHVKRKGGRERMKEGGADEEGRKEGMCEEGGRE